MVLVIKYARINSPDGTQVKIKVNDLVLHRDKFDKFLFDKAIDFGVKSKLGHRFISLDEDLKILRFSNKHNFVNYHFSVV